MASLWGLASSIAQRGSELAAKAKEASGSALEVVKRDLSEFATTVKDDTGQVVQRIIDENEGKVVGADEGAGSSGGSPVGSPLTEGSAARLAVLQTSRDTYALPVPRDEQPEFEKWRAGFDLAEQGAAADVRLLLAKPAVLEIFHDIVPDALSQEEFWARYFFRRQRLQDEMDARRAIMEKAFKASQQGIECGGGDDLGGWEDEDGAEDGAEDDTEKTCGTVGAKTAPPPAAPSLEAPAIGSCLASTPATVAPSIPSRVAVAKSCPPPAPAETGIGQASTCTGALAKSPEQRVQHRVQHRLTSALAPSPPPDPQRLPVPSTRGEAGPRADGDIAEGGVCGSDEAPQDLRPVTDGGGGGEGGDRGAAAAATAATSATTATTRGAVIVLDETGEGHETAGSIPMTHSVPGSVAGSAATDSSWDVVSQVGTQEPCRAAVEVGLEDAASLLAAADEAEGAKGAEGAIVGEADLDEAKGAAGPEDGQKKPDGGDGLVRSEAGAGGIGGAGQAQCDAQDGGGLADDRWDDDEGGVGGGGDDDGTGTGVAASSAFAAAAAAVDADDDWDSWT